MSNDETLSPKQMDDARERAEADTQAVVAHNARIAAQKTPPVEKACIPATTAPKAEMTKE